jgi:predicted ATPase
MLILHSVGLHRFKAAFEPPPVQLQPFSLLIGRNGSGKSTVLEALQWIDTTLRRDAREASERYRGILDVVNLRSQVKTPYFGVDLEWENPSMGNATYRYSVKVQATEDSTPEIVHETLAEFVGDKPMRDLILAGAEGRELVEGGITVREPDRLALGLLGSVRSSSEASIAIRDWWTRAVFLRLSPSRLAEAALAHRRSFDPLLDEEGHNLAALLNELTSEQRAELVYAIQEVLPGMRGVEVSTEGSERSQRANYSLLERMPYRGRAGKYQFPIPAWMLSEGTRRLTAMLALLTHSPPPSLLCIEEVENGLDPWTVKAVLAALYDASEDDSQIVLTTHSPWLLDHVPLQSVLFVKREEGNTVYTRFDELEDVAAFDPSIPPGTRYVNIEE